MNNFWKARINLGSYKCHSPRQLLLKQTLQISQYTLVFTWKLRGGGDDVHFVPPPLPMVEDRTTRGRSILCTGQGTEKNRTNNCA